jgi:hypothetical protein
MDSVSLAVIDAGLRWVLDLNLSTSSRDWIAGPAIFRVPRREFGRHATEPGNCAASRFGDDTLSPEPKSVASLINDGLRGSPLGTPVFAGQRGP